MLIDYTKDLQSKALENYNILSTSQGALQVLKNKSMKCPNFEWKEDHTPGRGLPGRDRSSIQARDRDGWQRIRGRRRSRTETEASTPMGGQQFSMHPSRVRKSPLPQRAGDKWRAVPFFVPRRGDW
jgi:hypothetical protein